MSRFLTCTYLGKRKEGWLCVGTGHLVPSKESKGDWFDTFWQKIQEKLYQAWLLLCNVARVKTYSKSKKFCEAERWQLDRPVVSGLKDMNKYEQMHFTVAVGQTLSGPKAEKHTKTCSAADTSELMIWRYCPFTKMLGVRSCMNSVCHWNCCYRMRLPYPPHHCHCSLKRLAKVIVFVD